MNVLLALFNKTPKTLAIVNVFILKFELTFLTSNERSMFKFVSLLTLKPFE